MLPQLRRLEEAIGDDVVVVGVHAGKFIAERETSRIRHATRRLGVRHPVVNDRQFRIWRAYGVQAWPTLVFVAPDGSYLGSHAGEVPASALIQAVSDVRDGVRDQLTRPPLPLDPEPAAGDGLRYPAKIAAHGGRLYVADTGNGRVLECEPSSATLAVRRVIGDGVFEAPHGMAIVADRLYVSDPPAHRIFAAELADGSAAPAVSAVAGTGEQARGCPSGAVAAAQTPLSSPWDVASHDHTLYIAMAGTHQVWALDLRTGTLGRHAGSGAESIDDGPPAAATFAQPSGLAVHQGWLYVADAESSAVRRAGLAADGTVETLVGTGLFDFGDRDGTGNVVRLQHVLGLGVWRNGLVLADAYNDALKLLDPTRRSVRALTRGLHEPGGLAVVGDVAYVADTNAHRVVAVDLQGGEMRELTLNAS